MSPIKILAVEDDPIYTESLQMAVEQLDYEMTAVVDNASEALDVIIKESPDLILMDIEINDSIDGIELAARIKTQCSAPIIFVTSHLDRATFSKAKLTAPHAFVTKPYEKHSLQAAIELALLHTGQMQPAAHDSATTGDSFYIKDNGNLYKVNAGEVLYVESDKKYCTIYTASKRKYVVNMRLKEVMQRLSPADFIQTHRSYIVKKEAIEMINIADQTVKIAGKEIPIGKSHKTELFSTLNYL